MLFRLRAPAPSDPSHLCSPWPRHKEHHNRHARSRRPRDPWYTSQGRLPAPTRPGHPRHLAGHRRRRDRGGESPQAPHAHGDRAGLQLGHGGHRPQAGPERRRHPRAAPHRPPGRHRGCHRRRAPRVLDAPHRPGRHRARAGDARRRGDRRDPRAARHSALAAHPGDEHVGPHPELHDGGGEHPGDRQARHRPRRRRGVRHGGRHRALPAQPASGLGRVHERRRELRHGAGATHLAQVHPGQLRQLPDGAGGHDRPSSR